jgi:hypothetical protein
MKTKRLLSVIGYLIAISIWLLGGRYTASLPIPPSLYLWIGLAVALVVWYFVNDANSSFAVRLETRITEAFGFAGNVQITSIFKTMHVTIKRPSITSWIYRVDQFSMDSEKYMLDSDEKRTSIQFVTLPNNDGMLSFEIHFHTVYGFWLVNQAKIVRDLEEVKNKFVLDTNG